MNIVAIIQARCGSSRFPEKVFAELAQKPLIWHVVNRLRFSTTITDVVLATTENPLDEKLYEWAIKNKIKVFRGSENNVLDRYAKASIIFDADIIIRVTADDPFKDPNLIDQAVNLLISEKADFVCNNTPPSYPEGLDVEVFTQEAILRANEKANQEFEREHVTQYFYRNPKDFKILNIKNTKDLSHLRWTIDTEADWLMTRQVYDSLYKNDDEIFYMDNILNLLHQNPEIAAINSNVSRSFMYKK